MKALLVALSIFGAVLFLTPAAEATYVSGYYRSNGTYVQPHYRSNPNGLTYDNYSYRSGSLYNSSYGTRGSSWDTPTWNTQSDYYTGYGSYRLTPRPSYNSYIGY